MFITDEGATQKLTVRFPGSEEEIVSPYTPGQGDAHEPAFMRAARWAMKLASGRDPGKLYAKQGAGCIVVTTRRRIATKTVVVSLGRATVEPVEI